MKNHKQVEEWADALLEQHRSGEPAAPSTPVPYDELPPLSRLAVNLGAEPPDRERLERINRLGHRFRGLRGLKPIVMSIGFIAVGGLLLAFYAAQ